MTRTALAILAIIAKHGASLKPPVVLPDGLHVSIRRTRAGRHMRSNGAWAWFLEFNYNSCLFEGVQIGGQVPASELARLGPDGCELSWEHGSVAIDPAPTHNRRSWTLSKKRS